MAIVPLAVQLAGGTTTQLRIRRPGEASEDLLVQVRGGAGTDGIRVEIDDRSYDDYVQRDWAISRPAGARGEFSGTAILESSDLVVLPNPRDIITVYDNFTGEAIFGGRLDEPLSRVLPGLRLYEIEIKSLSWRARLDDRALTQSEGVEIVQLSAADQVEAIADLFADEGFTYESDLASGAEPVREDIRFSTAASVLDRLCELKRLRAGRAPEPEDRREVSVAD